MHSRHSRHGRTASHASEKEHKKDGGHEPKMLDRNTVWVKLDDRSRKIKREKIVPLWEKICLVTGRYSTIDAIHGALADLIEAAKTGDAETINNALASFLGTYEGCRRDSFGMPGQGSNQEYKEFAGFCESIANYATKKCNNAADLEKALDIVGRVGKALDDWCGICDFETIHPEKERFEAYVEEMKRTIVPGGPFVQEDVYKGAKESLDWYKEKFEGRSNHIKTNEKNQKAKYKAAVGEVRKLKKDRK